MRTKKEIDKRLFELAVAESLCTIEDLFKEYNVAVTALTLVARDPNKPEMYTVVSNDKQLSEVVALLETVINKDKPTNETETTETRIKN